MTADGKWIEPVLQLDMDTGVACCTPPIPLIDWLEPAACSPNRLTSEGAIKEMLAPVSSANVNGP